ncbi:glutathione synthase [Flagelloscypha sp. PMI_526]|nr:glutathione synthase [Flagelloscypha sp. PMI_526]
MASSFDFASWPPDLSNTQLDELRLNATRFALANGLLYLPPHPPSGPPPATPSSAIHAPLSLVPSPLPRHLFEQAWNIQRVYNHVYARVAMDYDFLDKVLGAEQGVGKVDDFVGKLWKGWKAIRDDGVQSGLHLGIFRSDYLIHDGTELKQVEFNTISSSFGTLSERVARLHRYLARTTDYFGTSPALSNLSNFPENNTTKGVVQGLAEAHKAYLSSAEKTPAILFVVQPNERNVFDQLWLEYELMESHGIKIHRRTLTELASSASLHASGALIIDGTIEVSVVYYRAGYTPNDYFGEDEWNARFLLERSNAINCPSIPLHLAGSKKIQEVLTQPDVVERYLPPSSSPSTSSDLRRTWQKMFSLDVPRAIQNATEGHLNFVLKPQREGGGNNVYHTNIPNFLQSLPVHERAAWIAMELIRVPAGVGGYLVRSGADPDAPVTRSEIASELGIFGWALFGDGEVKKEDTVGWLVRTKGKESDEGGVATGFSVLDSLVLV